MVDKLINNWQINSADINELVNEQNIGGFLDAFSSFREGDETKENLMIDVLKMLWDRVPHTDEVIIGLIKMFVVACPTKNKEFREYKAPLKTYLFELLKTIDLKKFQKVISEQGIYYNCDKYLQELLKFHELKLDIQGQPLIAQPK